MARKGVLEPAAVSSLLANGNLFPLSKDSMGGNHPTGCHPCFKAHYGLPVQVENLALHLLLYPILMYIFSLYYITSELGFHYEGHSMSPIVS